MALMSEGCGFDAGKRASVENSSTSVRTVSTDELMVTAHWRMTLSDAASGGVARSRWRRMRSADKRERRERILDLMRDAARHLAPCGLLLRAQNVGEVFQHDDVAGALPAIAQGCRMADRAKRP